MRIRCFPAVRSPQSAALLLLLLCARVGWAEPVTVRAQLSESTVYLGDSVQLELRMNGLRNPDPPDIRLPDIDATSEGGQSFSNSSISMVNGRTSVVEEFGYSARYRLRPRVAGVLKIPPIAVRHAGQTYYSQPVTLVVKQPADQDQLLVEVYTDKPSYVLGERIRLTLDLSLRKLTVDDKELEVDPFFRERPPHLQIPWFESLGDWKTVDLATFVQPFLGQQRPGFFINNYIDQRGFFRDQMLTFTLPRHSTRRQRPSGTFNYFTYRLQKEFRPIRSGTQTIPSVLVKAALPTLIDARGRAQRTENFVASSQPITVQVQPVPSAGRPASFSGAVGRFQIDVAATPTVLKVGDPLTVTVTVRSAGDSLLETVRPLRLQDQAALAQDFKIYTDAPTVETGEDSKTFTYTLRPRHPNVHALPPIELAYYDPDTGRFQVRHSKPVPLRVEGASPLEASEVIVTSEVRPTSTLGRQLAEGLLANYTGAEVLVPQQAQIRITPVIGGLVVLPPVAYVLLLLSRQLVRRRRQDPGRQRSRKAVRTALAALRSLKNQQQASEADICEGVHRTLTGYISDKLDLTGAGLTVGDVTRYLDNRGLEQDLIDQAEALLQRCDGVRYTPGTLAVMQLTELITDTESLVQRLEASARL
jgi:hypothetical protein